MSARVLYLLANAEPGGAERVTLMMMRHHSGRYRPQAMFLNDGSLIGEVRRMGLPASILGRRLRLRRPLEVLAAIRECRRRIARDGIDLLHACMPYAHIVGSPAAGRAIPRVLFQHGPVGGPIDRAASLLSASLVLANSRHTLERHRRIALRRWPDDVVPCATELRLSEERRRGLAAEMNARLGLTEETIVLGAIGRFDPWKGIHVALSAALPILRERADVRFLVVGDQYRRFHPEYARTLREFSRAEGAGGRILFAGFQDDVLPYLARMDIVVHSATAPEPFGLVVIEAMAAGCAVIASAAGGPLEIVTEGVDGLLHPPGDESALRTAMRRLIDDASLRRSLGDQGRRTVAARYSPPAMVERLEAHYDRLLAARRGVAARAGAPSAR
ncbi:MAG TPA: glycosyltransferase family 4 protein [Candidatus Polarisedimenticolia bacterium]|nr:glycosyltransferase family 4 protein [Candidatus Polarisedimenticolia bacterium]